MRIELDTENAASLAAACRAMAAALAGLAAGVEALEQARPRDSTALLRLLPLMCLSTQGLPAALLWAVQLREIAARLDALPATEAELDDLRASLDGWERLQNTVLP